MKKRLVNQTLAASLAAVSLAGCGGFDAAGTNRCSRYHGTPAAEGEDAKAEETTAKAARRKT